MSRNPDASPPVRRIDRILTFMSLGILALAICAFIATIIAGATGVENYDGFVWQVVFVVQFYGPVVAFALLLVVLIMSFVRRGRANK